MAPPSGAPDPNSAGSSAARRAGLGVLAITGAKVWFMLTGFAQPVLLTALLGASDYGVYGTVLNAISIVNNLLVAGSIQGMSKAVTRQGPRALRPGLALHLALGLLTLGVLFAISEPLGARVLRDPELPGLLRIAAVVAANYCVYAALVGALNGRQAFTSQAGLDITFATLRTGLVLGGAWHGGVRAALQGFALASVLITGLAALVVWSRWRRVEALEPTPSTYREAAPPEGSAKEPFLAPYLAFFLPVLLYQLMLNLVMQADLLGLKAALARHPNLGLVAVNAEVGLYKAVQNFAFLPYQLLLAVTFVAFPVVAEATLRDDRGATMRFLHGAMRFAVLLLGMMLGILAGMPRGVLRIAYGASMAAGAGALRILSIGQGAFALCVLGTTVVLAAGHTGRAVALMAGLLACVGTGDAIALRFASDAVGDAALHTAAGTTAGCLLGLVLIGTAVRRMFGAFIPVPAAARAALAGAVTAGALSVLPTFGRVLSMGEATVGVTLYAALLLLLGEVSPEERARLRQRLEARLGRRAHKE